MPWIVAAAVAGLGIGLFAGDNIGKTVRWVVVGGVAYLIYKRVK